MVDKSKQVLMLLSFAGFIVMADNWVVSPLLPAISTDIAVSTIAAGILITAYMLPFSIFQLIFGPLADRFGKTKVILVTFSVFAVATTLCAFGAGLTDLIVFRALTGLFAASTMPVSFALISEIVPVERRQQAIGSFMGVSTLGQALSMGIGGSIAYFFDWRGVFVIYGIIAVIIAILLWFRLPAATRGKEVAHGDTPMFKPYLSLLSESASLRTYLIIFFEGIFLLGSFSYFGAMLSARFSLSFLAIGGVMTAFGIAALIGGRVSSKLTNRIGRKPTVALGLFLMALANGLIWTGFLNPVLATVAVFMLGFGFMTTHSNLITMATGFNPEARGAAMSLAPFSFMLGGAIGTQLAAPLIAATSYMVMYVVFGFGLLLLGLITTKILPDIDLGE